MSEKNVPEVRFQGFSGEWEIKLFSDVFYTAIPTNTLSRANLNYKGGEVRNIHYGDVLIKFGEITDVKKKNIPFINGADITKYKSQLLANGDVIFADTAEDETVGKATEITGICEDNVVSGLHTIPVRPRNLKPVGYLGYYVNSNYYHKQLFALMQGIKVLSISKRNLTNTSVSYPLLDDEQTKIGDFFKNLDNLIAQNQKKYDKLVNMKKACLDKMFPKDGADTPDVRFKEFSGQWESKLFSEVFDTFIPNNTLSRAGLNYENGEVKNIHYGDILIKFSEITNVKKANIPFITDPDIAKYKGQFLANGDIIFADTAEDETVGKATEIAEIDKEKVVSGLHTIAVRAKRLNPVGYLGYYINSKSYRIQLLPLMQGVKVLSISKRSLASTNVRYPLTEQEQTQIGTFFQNLDNLITLRKTELEKLKNMKKACLDKMFI